MKVGVYLDAYQPEDGGGYTMQSELFRALCRNHEKTSHQFCIISRPGQLIEEECRRVGLGWVPDIGQTFADKVVSSLARIWPNFSNQAHWRSTLERETRKIGIEFIWILGPRPKPMDTPYLAIVLDLQHRKQPWFPEVSEYGQWETRERLLAPFLRRASGIIVGTEAGKREIVEFYQVPENRIHKLPHPVPDFVRSLSAAAGTKSPKGVEGVEPGFLFYPAQFWTHKNHVNLLIAIKQLADEGLRIPLVLTGSDFGNQAFVKQKIAELDLEKQVRIIGFVKQDELVWLYKNALALTYVSFFGPENLPPLEAFASGCPVIATQLDGAEEQMGDAALLVNPMDPNEIAWAIRRLAEDRELRNRLIIAGHKRAAMWTSDDFVLGVFKVLDEFQPIRRTWD